jgi:hypothetical protein
MRRLKVVATCLGTLVVCALVACGPQTTTSHPQGQQFLPPAGTPQRPVGVPAIAPHLNQTPAVTEADVMQYVITHPVPYNIAPSGPVSVAHITCTASSGVSQLLGGVSTGFPDDYVLCLAELAGHFEFPSPAVPSRAIATYSQAFEVFDAESGNLVLAGGLGPQAT